MLPLLLSMFESPRDTQSHSVSDLNTTWSSSFSMDKQMSSKKSACLVAQSCPTLATPWTVACQAPLSMEFIRQEHWSGLPLSSPGDLSDPGIETASPMLAGGFFTIMPPGKRITCKTQSRGRGGTCMSTVGTLPSFQSLLHACLQTYLHGTEEEMVLKHYPTSVCPLLSPALTSPLHPRLTHPSVYLGVQPNTSKTNSKPTPFNFLISVTDTSVLLVALVKELGVPLAVSLTLHSIHQPILSTPLSVQDLISSHRPHSSTKVLGNISICHSGFLNGLLVSTPFPTEQSTLHATARVSMGLHHPLLHPAHSSHLRVEAVVLTRAHKSYRTQTPSVPRPLTWLPFLTLLLPPLIPYTHSLPQAPDLCSLFLLHRLSPQMFATHFPPSFRPWSNITSRKRSLTTPHEIVMVPLFHTSCSFALLFPGTLTCVCAKSPSSCLTL